MSDPIRRPRRQRLEEALYQDSLKRLKKRGIDDEHATRVAKEVAKQAAERTKAPEFDSEQELASTVYAVCRSLSDGKSYYDLIGERPYLVTGRIDRLVAAAARVRPEVPAEVASAANKATKLERLSGGLSVLFTGIALMAVGIWYALAVGLIVSAGSELYVQTWMPKKARQMAARYHLTRWFGGAGLVVLLLSAYSWLDDGGYVVWKSIGLALFTFVVAAVIPGLTLAVLVGVRERRWRSSLERELTEQQSGSPK